LYLAHLFYLKLRIEPDLLSEKALQLRLYSWRSVKFKIEKR
jgi:hypothetical protein